MSKKPAGAGRSSFDLIDPARFFSNIKIDPGAHILDAGCGVGRYSIGLSKRLDDKGVIYAVDDWDEGIESLRSAIREKGLSNINPIKADITVHIPLENGSIDLCLMATVLHDLPAEGQDSALRGIARVLKPGGVFAFVEFKKIDQGPGPPIGIRISEQEAEEKIKKYGFLKTFLGEVGEFNYLLTLKKTT